MHNKDLFVSINGNDLNNGTFENPFRTLEAARNYIRNSVEKGGFTVYIREGIYEIKNTFELNILDSGTDENPNIYKAYKGEKVRLVGGIFLNPQAFTKVIDVNILSRIPKEAHNDVIQIDLSGIGIDFGEIKQNGHFLPVTTSALELFFNDEVMTLARYPNDDYIEIGRVIDKGSVPRNRDYSERGAIFEYTDNRHSNWVNSKDVWLYGTFNNGYADDLIKVDYIDAKTHQIKLAMPHLYGVDSGFDFQHYYAINLLEELDMPGEWYLDRDSGILYFWPPKELISSEISISILEDPIVSLEGASNIVIQGITIEIGRGVCLYIEGGENNIIKDCIIRNVGTTGILMGKGAKQTFPHNTHDDYEGVEVSRQVGSLQAHLYKDSIWNRDGGKNQKIVNCKIYNTGSGGVYLCGGSKKELISGNNEIINCEIHDYNRKNKFQWGGVNVDGCGNRVANCEIYNSDFMGIYVRGNNHICEFNNIHNVTQNTDDGCAWYMGRDFSDRGNIIRYNLFHHIGRLDRKNMCIYCDDFTSDVFVYGNIFYKCYTIRGLVFGNSSSYIKVMNNISIDCPVPFVEISSFLYTWGKDSWEVYFGSDGIARKRLELVNYKNAPYSIQYPEISDLLEPIGSDGELVCMRPKGNIMKGNIICHLGSNHIIESEALKYDEFGNPMDKHKVTYNGNKIVYRGDYAQFDEIDNFEFYEDIGFKDVNKIDFTLKDDSIIFSDLPKFENIDFHKIGLLT